MTPPSGTVERIVVALLADADRRATAEIAAALAQHFGVDIAGILVEERELFDLAELALGSEFGMTTGRARMAGAGGLIEEMRLSLARHERDFAALAQEIGRGVALARERLPAAEPLRRAGPTDLLLCAASSRRLIEREMAEAIFEAARRAAGVGIVGRAAAGRPGPLVAVASSREKAERALPLLSGLSEAYRSRLEIVVADAPGLETGRRREAEGAAIGWSKVEAVPAGRAAAELAATRGARLLIGEAGATLARDPAELKSLLRATAVPVLLLNVDRD